MNCLNCNRQTENPKFCSRHCNAVYNNKHFRKRTLKVVQCTCSCGNSFIRKDWKQSTRLCPNCVAKNKTNFDNLTKGSAKTSDTQRHRRIRSNAQKIARQKFEVWSCQVCGYDKYVEVCHIKSIESFPDSALVSEINHPNNLIILCPNHHWEFDHIEA